MAFTGQLNRNEIYNALFNMIISQEIFPDRIAEGDDLVDKAKTDGSLYGDTKLYYSVDALASREWLGDEEAKNLLQTHRAKAPEVQSITLDKFRVIPLTLDDYLSKRAWSDEGTFGTFNAIMGGMLQKTKYIYSSTTYAAFFGTHSVDGQKFSVDIAANGSTPEAEVKTIADAVANLVDRMCSSSKKFNEYGQRTKFRRSDITVVWNGAYINKFNKVDLPGVFNAEMVTDQGPVKQAVLPAQYWGAIDATDTTVPSDGTYRALTELTIGSEDYMPGDIVPAGSAVEAGSIYKSDCDDDTLLIDSDHIATVIVKYPPYMTAFEVGSSFWNPLSLTTNRYLIWGENELTNLQGYPFCTVTKAS